MPLGRLIRRGISSTFAWTFGGWFGAYDSANPSNKTHDDFRPRRATSAQTTGPVFQTLTAQCRHLERNSAIARGAVEGLKAGIVGTGIDIEPDTGDEGLDDELKEAWLDWCEDCGVGGESLWELQNLGLGEAAVSSGMLWRLVVRPERLDEGKLPLAILPLETEWLSDLPVEAVPAELSFVGGVLYDADGVVRFYDLRNPDDLTGLGERVPAEEIVYGFEKRRAHQGHGEPLIVGSVSVIKQGHDLVNTELRSAHLAASLTGTIKSKDGRVTPTTTETVTDADGNQTERHTVDVEAGSLLQLFPDEDAELFDNKRPAQPVARFFDVLRGLVAAACRVGQSWLDRDSSRANYSSMRDDQLRDKKLHAPLQLVFGRHMASRVYHAVFEWLLLELGVPMPVDARERRRLMRHELLPDQPEYVDPQKDGAAAVQNVDGKLMSLTEAVAARGRDLRTVVKRLDRDRRLLQRYGFDLPTPTNQATPPAEEETQPAAETQVDDEDEVLEPRHA